MCSPSTFYAPSHQSTAILPYEHERTCLFYNDHVLPKHVTPSGVIGFSKTDPNKEHTHLNLRRASLAPPLSKVATTARH